MGKKFTVQNVHRFLFSSWKLHEFFSIGKRQVYIKKERQVLKRVYEDMLDCQKVARRKTIVHCCGGLLCFLETGKTFFISDLKSLISLLHTLLTWPCSEIRAEVLSVVYLG